MGKEASSRANTSISPNTEKLESYQLQGRNKHWKINTFTSGTVLNKLLVPRRPGTAPQLPAGGTGVPAAPGGAHGEGREQSVCVCVLLQGLLRAGKVKPGLPDTTLKLIFGAILVLKANLTLPRILLHQHHPQVVCLPHASLGRV